MIQALLPAVLPLVKDAVGAFLPEDKNKRAEAERKLEADLASHLAKIDVAQLEVNKVEAAHRSVFIAGWRPFIGWSLGFSLAWTYLCQPILTFALIQAGYGVELPSLDMAEMMPVLMGMLGLGGLRTFEKYKSVSK